MARRGKQILWHKKQQKFISPTLLKPHHAAASEPDPSPAGTTASEKKKAFVQDLVKKIRAAVRE